MTSHYQLLNLHSAATEAEIRDAYVRERARVIAVNPNADEILAGLDEAYTTLVDPVRRADYDRVLGFGVGSERSLVLRNTPQPINITPTLVVPIVMQQACPHCGALNPVQATMCLTCGRQVSRPCPSCGISVVLGQTVCPRCNTLIPEYDARRLSEVLKVEENVQTERMVSEARVNELEAGHRERAKTGFAFWGIVFVLLAVVGAAAACIFTLLVL